jgi:protein TonB
MFETALIESRRHGKPGRTLLTLPLAVSLHAVFIAGAVAAQLWAVADVPEPVVQAIFYPVPADPPPGPKTEPQTASVPPSPKPPIRHELSQPTTVTDSVPAPTAEPADSPDDPGIAGGLPRAGDSPGGEGDGGRFPPKIAPEDLYPPEPPDRVYYVGGAIAAPVAVYRVDPVYPEAARLARRQGAVVIEAKIDASGNVEDARILTDQVGCGAGESALEAVRHWRYEPARYRGAKVAVYLRITIQFTLH